MKKIFLLSLFLLPAAVFADGKSDFIQSCINQSNGQTAYCECAYNEMEAKVGKKRFQRMLDRPGNSLTEYEIKSMTKVMEESVQACMQYIEK